LISNKKLLSFRDQSYKAAINELSNIKYWNRHENRARAAIFVFFLCGVSSIQATEYRIPLALTTVFGSAAAWFYYLLSHKKIEFWKRELDESIRAIEKITIEVERELELKIKSNQGG